MNKYLRSNAVAYAKTFALKPNPAYRYFPLIGDSSGDCANFLSQCLYAGGAPMTYDPKHSWWYNNKNTSNVMDDTWSIPWAVANSLYYYLKINQSINYFGAKGVEVFNKKELELGDFIFFEGSSGAIFHSAIITSFSRGEPLISQHSYEALNIPYTSSWPAKRHHFIKITI